MDKSQFADVESLGGPLALLTTDGEVDSDVVNSREDIRRYFGWSSSTWYSRSENASGLHDCLEAIWEQLVEPSASLQSDFDSATDETSQREWVKTLGRATASKDAASPQAAAETRPVAGTPAGAGAGAGAAEEEPAPTATTDEKAPPAATGPRAEAEAVPPASGLAGDGGEESAVAEEAPAPTTASVAAAPPPAAELWDEARGITVTPTEDGHQFTFGGRTLTYEEVTEVIPEYDALTVEYGEELDDEARAAIAADPDANVGAATELILRKLAERASGG